MNKRVLAVAVASVMLACGDSSDGGTKPTEGSEDERGSVGVPPPAAKYCTDLGYTESLSDSACVFPDGTRCEEWSFYRGECGQAHSYCNLHGGSVRAEDRDMGGWTSRLAVCDLDGKSCVEQSFLESGKCD